MDNPPEVPAGPPIEAPPIDTPPAPAPVEPISGPVTTGTPPAGGPARRRGPAGRRLVPLLIFAACVGALVALAYVSRQIRDGELVRVNE